MKLYHKKQNSMPRKHTYKTRADQGCNDLQFNYTSPFRQSINEHLCITDNDPIKNFKEVQYVSNK